MKNKLKEEDVRLILMLLKQQVNANDYAHKMLVIDDKEYKKCYLGIERRIRRLENLYDIK